MKWSVVNDYNPWKKCNTINYKLNVNNFYSVADVQEKYQ